MTLRHLCLAAVLLAAPLAGCMTPAEGGPSGTLVFDEIDRGPNSEITDREEVVVRTEEAWRQLWQRHAPEEDRPEVDLEETMVLAIFKGQSPDGCHGAEIENVTGDGERIHVEGAYFEVTDAHCTQQVTHPFHIVAVDHHDVEVVFDIREETRQIGDGSGSEEPSDGNDTDQPDDGSGQASYNCREPSEASDGSAAENVSFQTLDEGDDSGIHEACVAAAQDQGTWRELWRDHMGGASTADDQRPEVDFDESVVAAIFKGESSDACHGAEIEEITRDGEDLVVHGVFYVVEGQACAEVVTYPFHIVEVEKPAGEISFDVTKETRQA